MLEAESDEDEEEEVVEDEALSDKDSEFCTASPSERRGQVADLTVSPITYGRASYVHPKRPRPDDE